MNCRAELPDIHDLSRLHGAQARRYPFLLESVAAHPQSGRYDLLLGGVGEKLVARPGEDFLAALSAKISADSVEIPENDGGLPFIGGWFIYLGYELAGQVEPALRLPVGPQRLPDAFAVRCRSAIIVDRVRGVTTLMTEDGAGELERLRSDLLSHINHPIQPSDLNVIHSIVEDDAARFVAGVERIRDYLAAGDVFQVNLSRAWHAELKAGVTVADLYQRLRRSNPAPFAASMRWDDSAVISSSPERLVQIADGWVQTRPIAGTRPRGLNPEDDSVHRSTLLSSLKERAEHIMLIDLERNDLGRVCEPGSIEVSELMTIESYAHVQHIVSNVRGRLKPQAGPIDAIRAVFPGGTITGCPKVRAMQIIAELEGVARGPYTGAMGYWSRCGRLDMNILIRSMLVEGERVTLRAGAGIVADSDPQAELAETRAKARGMLLALGVEA